MNKRLFKGLSLITILALVLMALPAQSAGAVSTSVVISQFQVAGGTAADEFVELHNVGNASVDLNGYRLVYRSAAGTSDVAVVAWAATTIIPAGGYYLIAAAVVSGAGYDDTISPDITFNHSGTGTFAGAGGGFAVRNGALNTGTIIDSVGYGTATNVFIEGTVTAAPGANISRIRKVTSCQDTDNNSADFDLANPSIPRNSTSTVNTCAGVTDPKINEFSASTAGTDVEYVEFIGDPNTDYSAFTLLEIEGDSGTAIGTVDEVLSLGTTNASGFYLANLPANALENGSLSLLLVKNFTGALNNDLDTDNNGVFDSTPWSAIVDSVAVNDGGAGDVTYGAPTLGVSYDGQPFAPGGASRIPDGADTDTTADWVRNDFDLAGIPGFTGTPVFGEAYNTPGAANAVVLPKLAINEIDYDQPGTDTAEFVEIRNNDSVAISLSGWTLELVNGNGGGAAVYDTIALPNVSLAAGDYFVVCANTATVSNCDLDDGPDTDFIQNGAPDGAGLRFNGTLIDAVSYEGNTGAPYTEGSGTGLEDPGTTGSNNLGISRCPDGNDTNQNNVDFATRPITPGAVNDCIVDAPPTVLSTIPANGTTDAATGTNININFSEPVTVSGTWFNINCSLSGVHTATVSGGPQNYSLDPDVNFTSGDSCTVTIFAANVTDQDGTANNMTANYVFSFTSVDVCSLTYTPIYNIQGSGSSTPIPGVVTTQGVVVGDYEGPSPALRGFYIQDPAGDGNAATSDGIFVFNGTNNSVNLGDLVRVTGTAEEFQDQTEIGSVTSIAPCGTGSVTPTDITLPVPSATYLEQYEGMLVRFPQTLYVTEHFQLGRFGQVVMSSGGKLQQPTNVVAPGAPAIALQNANNLNRIIVDDELQNQNPDPIRFGRGGNPLTASNTLRGGDTATGMVGVLSYTWAGDPASGNAYRLRPINALGGGVPNFQAANTRPTSPPNVNGTVRVVGMNLLNFFNTFTGCKVGVTNVSIDCRGASSQQEFDRQWPKTVAAILALNPDVLGVNELENDGYGSTSALQFLVDKLNDATAPGTYAFIDVDANTGQINAMGSDAIRVAMIYKLSAVTPVGQTSALNSIAFVNGGDSAPRSRPSLMQAYQVNATGAVFIVDLNHLKSKGSACDAPDAGDGQGNCNQVRVNAVNALLSWFATDPTGTGDPDILMIGDYNSYAKEDPIAALEAGGFTNLVSSIIGPDAYSYVFDGQWGYLDQALGSSSILSQVTGVTDYHINSDEPSVLDYLEDFKSTGQLVSLYAPDQYRVSDHDPVLIGLNPNAAPTVDAGGPYSVNEGSSVAVSATGSDPNGDSLTYAWDLDNNGSFETPGQSATFSAASLDGPSSYTVKVKATDPGGLSAVDTATVNVQNVAPSVNTPSVSPEPSIKGAAVTASATFGDPAPNDAPFTCSVDYGDGSGTLAGTVSGNSCTGPSHTYSSVGSFTVTVSVTDKDGSTGSNSSSHAVIYNFTGFFQPVDNPPTVNSVKAGQAIPVKFSLSGNQGLNIFAAGYPKIVFTQCPSGTVDPIETTVTASNSGLSYDPATDQYIYTWKTDKSWAGQCGTLQVQFIDGTTQTALFKFTQ